MKSVHFKVILITLLLALIVLPNLAEGKSENSGGQGKSEEKQKNQVVIGDVKQATENNIVVEKNEPSLKNKEKKNVNITIDKNTKVIGENKKKLKVNSIKPKDLVAVVSSGSATESSKSKRAVKIFVKSASSAAQLQRSAIQGVITNINGLNITVAHQIQRERTYNIITNSFTVVKMKGGKSASESATLRNLQVGQRIVAVGENSGDKTIVAKMIHIIPGKATGIFKKQPLATAGGAILPQPTTTATLSATSTTSPETSPTSSLIP